MYMSLTVFCSYAGVFDGHGAPDAAEQGAQNPDAVQSGAAACMALQLGKQLYVDDAGAFDWETLQTPLLGPVCSIDMSGSSSGFQQWRRSCCLRVHRLELRQLLRLRMHLGWHR